MSEQTVEKEVVLFVDCVVRNLSGPLAPDEWRGGLNISYRIGRGYEDSHL